MHFEELAVNAALQRGSDESGSGSSSGSGVSDTGSCTICGTTTNLPEHHHVECGADAGLATSAGAGGIDKCAADVAPAAVDTTAAEAEVRSVMDPPTDVITSPSGSVVVVTVPPPAPPIISTTAVTSSSDTSLVVTPSKVRREVGELTATFEFLEKDVEVSASLVGLTFTVRVWPAKQSACSLCSSPFADVLPVCRVTPSVCSLPIADSVAYVVNILLTSHWPMDVLPPLGEQFGHKVDGVKYDAVLQAVKDSSPFKDVLAPGDQLVAIQGRRLRDSKRYTAP